MLSSRLKGLREECNISQRELADKIGVSQQTIGSWEVGRTNPDHEMLIKLAGYFNVSVDYVVGNVNYKKSLSFEERKVNQKIPNKAIPIIDSLERNSQAIEDLSEAELSELVSQMEFTIQYVKNKRNSPLPK